MPRIDFHILNFHFIIVCPSQILKRSYYTSILSPHNTHESIRNLLLPWFIPHDFVNLYFIFFADLERSYCVSNVNVEYVYPKSFRNYSSLLRLRMWVKFWMSGSLRYRYYIIWWMCSNYLVRWFKFNLEPNSANWVVFAVSTYGF